MVAAFASEALMHGQAGASQTEREAEGPPPVSASPNKRVPSLRERLAQKLQETESKKKRRARSASPPPKRTPDAASPAHDSSTHPTESGQPSAKSVEVEKSGDGAEHSPPLQPPPITAEPACTRGPVVPSLRCSVPPGRPLDMNPISMGPKLYRLQPVGTSAGNTISRKWYCKVCAMAFTSLEQLRKHSAYLHPEYVCSRCSRFFRTPYLKQIHEATCNRNYVNCRRCGHRAISRGQLNSHECVGGAVNNVRFSQRVETHRERRDYPPA